VYIYLLKIALSAFLLSPVSFHRELYRRIGQGLDDSGITPFYLDGSTPTGERVELCHRFNEGEEDIREILRM
jgi:hypothetical protein